MQARFTLQIEFPIINVICSDYFMIKFHILSIRIISKVIAAMISISNSNSSWITSIPAAENTINGTKTGEKTQKNGMESHALIWQDQKVFPSPVFCFLKAFQQTIRNKT